MKLLKLIPLLAVAALSGCATKYETMTPELQASMRADLKAGNLTLDCTIKCLFAWNQQLKNLQAFDVAERWDDLYRGVMQIGYKQDLSYYYLGQSAQGLGFYSAAIKYYRYSLALTGSESPIDKCASVSTDQLDACQGVDLPSVLPVLIKASQDALSSRSHAPAKAKKAAPAAGGNWAVPPAAGSTWSAPPPSKN